MRIAISEIHAAAASRPPEYLAEVLAAGKTDGDDIVISAADYAKLFAKYRGTDVPVFERNVAAAVSKFQSTCLTCP